MKIEKKHILIGGICCLALLTMSFASAKVSQAKLVFEQLKFGIAGFGKIGLKSLINLWFDVDIAIDNPTAQDFTVSTAGIISLKVVRVYQGEKLLGYGTADVSGIELKAGKRTVIKGIRLNVNITTAGGLVADLYKKHKFDVASYAEILPSLRYEIDLEALGVIYTFKQSF